MSITWHLWQLNEINRLRLENTIWAGPYAAEIVTNETEPRRRVLIERIRNAQSEFATLIDEYVNAYADDLNPSAIEGIRVDPQSR